MPPHARALTRLHTAQAGYVGEAAVSACAHGFADVDVELLLPVRAKTHTRVHA